MPRLSCKLGVPFDVGDHAVTVQSVDANSGKLDVLDVVDPDGIRLRLDRVERQIANWIESFDALTEGFKDDINVTEVRVKDIEDRLDNI